MGSKIKAFYNYKEKWVRWNDGSSSPEGQIEQADYIIKYTKLKNSNKFSIIEIGPNNAIMIKTLLEKCPEKIDRVVLVDGPPQIEKCKYRLRHYNQVEYYVPEDLNSVEGNFDLLVSCHCLAETTLEYQNYIYDKFFPVCNEVFILQTKSKTFGREHERVALSDLRKPNHQNLINNIKKHYKKYREFIPYLTLEIESKNGTTYKKYIKSEHIIKDQQLTWAIK
tara:strand:+ start:61 stop:729 length:669 start_codon:yes stop_codon:yes gene_type:complete